MTQTSTITTVTIKTVTITIVLALAVGAALWRFSSESKEVAGGANPTTATVKAGAEGQLQRSQLVADKNRRLTVENDRLRKEVTALESQVQELEADHRELTAQLAGIEGKQEPAVMFGEYADLAEVLQARWEEMGQSALSMTDDLASLLAARADQNELDESELSRDIAKANQALIAYVLDVGSKIKSHSPGNGAFTHPITQSNLLAHTLRQAGAELSPDQLQRITNLGESYEAAQNELDAAYDDDTPQLQKIFDEVELKREFTDGVRAVLSDRQLATAYRDETSDICGTDLFSPALIVGSTSQPFVVESVDELKDRLRGQAGSRLGLSDEEIAAHDDVFVTWVAAMKDRLEPVAASMQSAYTTEDALVAGRAQLTAMLELSRRLDLDPEQEEQLLGTSRFYVPRVVEPTVDEPAQ